MAERLFLQAGCRGSRNAAADAVREAISDAGGWLDDVHFFGNLSLALSATLPAGGLLSFAAALRKIGIVLDAECLTAVEEAAGRPQAEEIRCALQISFFGEEGDLRRPVPPVPG